MADRPSPFQHASNHNNNNNKGNKKSATPLDKRSVAKENPIFYNTDDLMVLMCTSVNNDKLIQEI